MKVEGYLLVCNRCKVETCVTWTVKSRETVYEDPIGWKEIKFGVHLCPDCRELYEIITERQETEMKNFYANE